jgi:DNA topoisomerase VI subunit A
MGTRQLYYRLKGYYNDQQSMDLIVQRLALYARVTPFSLGVLYEARGFVVGPATLLRRTVDREDMIELSTVRAIQPFSKEDWALRIERGCQGIILVESDVHSQTFFSNFMIGSLDVARP